AFGLEDGGHAINALDRTEQIDHGGQVIRPHVVHRPAARLEEEPGVGMPLFAAGAEHETDRSNGSADLPFIDDAAHGLMTGAEEGVRSAADAHAPGLCRFD